MSRKLTIQQRSIKGEIGNKQKSSKMTRNISIQSQLLKILHHKTNRVIPQEGGCLADWPRGYLIGRATGRIIGHPTGMLGYLSCDILLLKK